MQFGSNDAEENEKEEKMKRLSVSLVILVAVGSLLVGCSQAAPAPTQAPKSAEPTKAAAPAAPTSAPAAPTAAPAAKKVDYPQKGKAISIIVPWGAGGGADVGARLLAGGMEKDLGVPVQVVNKPGASGQIGMTDLAQARPDGYTIAYSALASVITNYADPDHPATFQRKDILPIASHVADVRDIAVSANSSYKTVKDLIDAAKASPAKVPIASHGILTDSHITALWLEKLAGVKFAIVQFTGASTAIPAVIGGHAEAVFGSVSEHLPQVKNGELRVLGIMDSRESKLLPGVKTLEAQGYPIRFITRRALYAPAGTPNEILGIISGSIKKVMDSEEHKKKLEDDLGLQLEYLGPDQLADEWNQQEKQIQELMPLAR